MITLTLSHVQDESPIIRTFYFQPAQPIDYQPGQFIELYLPHDSPDEKGFRREFTLSSSPSEELLAVTIKRASPSSSFKQTLWNMSPGDTLGANEPLGDFVLPLDTTTPLVWIAGGIGITPFRSQAVWLSDHQEERPVVLFHSIHDSNERIFDKHIQRSKPLLTHTVSTASQDRLSAQTILAAIPSHLSLEDALFYISGPESMVAAFSKELEQHNIAKDHIVTDAFLGYA